MGENSLSSGIAKLLGDEPLRRELGKKSSKGVEIYSPVTVSKKWLKLTCRD